MRNRLLYKVKLSIGIFLFLILGSINNVNSQVVRSWEYYFNPSGNLEASGNCIIHLSQGVTITGGNFKSTTNPNTRNVLLFSDDSGSLIKADTSTLGFGFSKIIYGGYPLYYAMATLLNDSNPARGILIAKIDSSNLNINFFIPDSNPVIYYDPLDMALLSNKNIVVGSRMENFPLVRLSLTCMDSIGTVVWQTVDSSFEIKNDLKIIADQNGGFYVSGSGRDSNFIDDFIFISHFNSNGSRDWIVKQYSFLPGFPFADFQDLMIDKKGYLWMTGTLMNLSGQFGILMKLDTTGNIQWSRTVLPLPYQNLICDESNNIYGSSVPMDGLNVFRIFKVDTSGQAIDSVNFQLSGYFNSLLNDIRIIKGGRIAATGDSYVMSFPKSDMFIAIYDSSLNLLGYDIFDSLNLLGESGRKLTIGNGDDLFVCGRFNYENQFETCNLGVVKYQAPLINEIDETIADEILNVYPNPSNGSFYLKTKNISKEKIQVCIYNSLGEAIYTVKLTGNKENDKLELKLPSGIYVIILKTETLLSTKKIMIINNN